MKNHYLLWLSLAPGFLFAQVDKGKIVFRETIKIELDMKLDSVEGGEAIKAMIPKSHENKKELLFSQDATLYKTYEAEDQVIEENTGNVHFKMIMSRPQEEIYKDLKNEKLIEKRDLFGRNFIIKKELESKKGWKLLPEKKVILGYNCLKATRKDSAATIEAWYTPDIPISSGPYSLGGLPGMILEASMNEGKISAVATEIKAMDPGAKLAPPEKGKEVTEEEFKQIVEEKTKEMNEMMGGSGRGGNRIIIKGK